MLLSNSIGGASQGMRHVFSLICASLVTGLSIYYCFQTIGIIEIANRVWEKRSYTIGGPGVPLIR